MDDNQMDVMLDSLGLLDILKMNDIEHHTVLKMLHDDGWIDMEVYFDEDVPQYLLEEEE